MFASEQCAPPRFRILLVVPQPSPRKRILRIAIVGEDNPIWRILVVQFGGMQLEI